MWDPQRKKDLFLIETKPLFAPHKILFVLQKKRSTQEAISLTYKIFSTVTKLQRYCREYLEAYNFLLGDKIFCSLTAILCWVILFREHDKLYEKFHVLRFKQGHKNKNW